MGDYNGWTNWETWQIPLWIDNDPYDYERLLRRLRTATSQRQTITGTVARRIAHAIFGKPFTPDMARGDWGRVNWSEVAEHWEEHRQELAAT